MAIAHLEPFAGVAGDMFVGACLDAGASFESIERAVASLDLPGVAVRRDRVRRRGLAAARFVVDLEAPAGSRARTPADVAVVVDRAELPAAVRSRCHAVFAALAEAEAAVHGCAVDAIHFHEVGAEDAIVDVVAACLGLHLLGVERLTCGVIATGSGTVRCEHGELPVPAPATQRLLTGVPLRVGAPGVERTTPTGAALVRVLVDAFEPPTGTFVVESVGQGAGSRDDAEVANVLRLVVGSSADSAPRTDVVEEIACTLDTADGETLAWLLETLLARGAADAFVAPVTMKKGRPGHVVTALVPPERADAVVAVLLEESTSLGVRRRVLDRVVLERWTETRDTPLGAVAFKCARLPSGAVVARPEDDELRRLAAEHDIGRRDLLARLANS